MISQRQERSFRHALVFLAGAFAMLGALLAVTRVSGGERSDPLSPAGAARQREQHYARDARSYCAQLIAEDAALQERCVRDQVTSAQEVYRVTLPMRDDDPRRRIFASCARAFGQDIHFRLSCYQEQLGALQLSASWIAPRRR